MSNLAFLFPGQGSQFIKMGLDLYETSPEARARFERADELLDLPLTDYMFGARADDAEAEERLKQTHITQPALYVHSLATMVVLDQHDQRPDMVAGHSLGEYSALAAAGAIDFEDGLRLVRRRGELMAEAGERRPGAMAAILGLDDEAASAVCQEATEAGPGLVQPANFNAPAQIVISGDEPAVARARALAKERGAKRVLPLPVSGAFHSPLMAYARDGLEEILTELPIQPPRCPVYLNVTAEPTTDPEEIRARLLEQLLAPVRWSQTLHRMHADGARQFIEIGAGSVLSGIVRRTLGREVDTAQVGSIEEALALLEHAV